MSISYAHPTPSSHSALSKGKADAHPLLEAYVPGLLIRPEDADPNVVVSFVSAAHATHTTCGIRSCA